MIRSAYLRVYRPAAAGQRFDRHVDGQRRRVLVMGEIGVWQESLREDAFVADWEGRDWVCPRTPRLRMLEGLLAFRNSYPGTVGSLLAPERLVDRATAELEVIYRSRPEAKAHILTSSWHVPLRWFAAFHPDEREVVEGAGGQPTIRYRTWLRRAKERLGDAATVLDEAGFDESIVEPVQDLWAWLDGFDREAMLELDYGSVARVFSDADLVLDETAADIAGSLEALRAGDFDEAGEHYATAAARWAPAQAMTYSN